MLELYVPGQVSGSRKLSKGNKPKPREADE